MRRTVRDRRGRRPGGFTLVELLVVVLIVILVSAVALPVVLPAITHRQLSEAARILQAEIAGARDRAIRAGHACGIRLLPDPAFVNTNNAFVNGNVNSSQILAYNRIVPLDLPPDYSLGKVSIPFQSNGMVTLQTYGKITGTPGGGTGVVNAPYPNPATSGLPKQTALYPTLYPPERADPAVSGLPYPDPWSKFVPGFSGSVLMLVAEPIVGGSGVTKAGLPYLVPNEPVNWWWNIRVGDQVQLNGEGNSYTVVGPIGVRPTNPATLNQNPELFVNVGPPGTSFGGPDLLGHPYDSPLVRNYGTDPNAATPAQFQMACQFLYLVNGVDDDGDGYVDDGWDGVDNDLSLITNFGPPIVQQPAHVIDNFAEWEQESWTGTLSSKRQTSSFVKPIDMPYTITRRPVPSPGSRVTTLPSNVVIDATSWYLMTTNGITQGSRERSQLSIDPASLYVDIMILPGGQVLPTTQFSNPASVTMTSSFFHFWLTERVGVVEPAAAPLVGNAYLPMPAGSAHYPSTAPPLQGDRILITLFTKSGQVVSNTIENFDGNNTSFPFQYAQLGVGEAK